MKVRSSNRLCLVLEIYRDRRLILRLTEIPIVSPEYWMDEDLCTDEVLKHVFRSATDEEMPLFKERVQCLREAGKVLCEVCSQFPPFVYIK